MTKPNNSDKELNNKKTPVGASSYSLSLNGLDYSTIFDTLKDHALKLVANANSEMSEEQWSDYINELTDIYTKALVAKFSASQLQLLSELKEQKAAVPYKNGYVEYVPFETINDLMKGLQG